MPVIDLHRSVTPRPLELIPHCYSYGSSHMVSTRCHLPLVLSRGDGEYDAGGEEGLAGLAAMRAGNHKVSKPT